MASTALLVSLFGGFAGRCQAWGPDGHMIVAHVADRLLDPKVQDVLLNDLGSTSLSDAATWCDDFDHSPIGRWSEPLHYINYPGQACAFDWARDCKQDLCNAGALLNYSGQVFDRSTSKESRLVALKFVIHMMGDIHQPLHVASADDRGGNDIHVETSFASGYQRSKHSGGHGHGHGGNLHQVWDATLVEEIITELGQERGENGDGSQNWQLLSDLLWKRLEGAWSSNLTEWRKVVAEDGAGGSDALRESEPPRGAALAAQRNPSQLKAGLSSVAGRTASLGCSHAYVGSNGHRIQSGETLGRDYFEFNRPIVEVQLAKAGARLAQVLSDSLELSAMAEAVFVV